MEFFVKTTVLFALGMCSLAIVAEHSQLYQLVGTSEGLKPSDITSTCEARSASHCAVQCLSSRTCKSFSVQQANLGSNECSLSVKANPETFHKEDSKTYKVARMSRMNTTATPPPPTTTDVAKTTSAPAPCTNPTIINQQYNCGSIPTFSATGIIKLSSNRALVFMTNGKYLTCAAIDRIEQQGASQCEGPYNITGDRGIDPSGTIFTSGLPTAGVGFIQSDMVDCRYYLFKGDTVYCYQHKDSYRPWMRPCTTGWTSMNIQSRFGARIPSDPDDVIGNLLYTHDFYFLKGNQVYKSTGDSTSGALAAGFPKPVHDVFPDIMCDITAATEGMNSGEYYSVVGNKVYRGKSGTVYDKGTLCHNT